MRSSPAKSERLKGSHGLTALGSLGTPGRPVSDTSAGSSLRVLSAEFLMAATSPLMSESSLRNSRISARSCSVSGLNNWTLGWTFGWTLGRGVAVGGIEFPGSGPNGTPGRQGTAIEVGAPRLWMPAGPGSSPGGPDQGRLLRKWLSPEADTGLRDIPWPPIPCSLLPPWGCESGLVGCSVTKDFVAQLGSNP